MDQELNNLKRQFDNYIDEIKKSKIYQDYDEAKTILENSDVANNIIANIKELQQAKKSCKHHNQDDLALKIESDLDRLHDQYDLLFEVVNFNMAYDNLVELVEELKYNIESLIN